MYGISALSYCGFSLRSDIDVRAWASTALGVLLMISLCINYRIKGTKHLSWQLLWAETNPLL